MSSPHQKSGANTLFLFFFFLFLFNFFLSPKPRFLSSQLFLFLFSAFSFFLSTPIWVVICIYGFSFFLSFFIYLDLVGFVGEFVVVLKVLVL